MTETLPQPPSEHALADVLAQYQADQDTWQQRSAAVQLNAAQAYSRLLHVAEHGDSSQGKRVALFLAATFNGRDYPFDLFELRAVDVAISDDMLVCIDALRWAKEDLGHLVPDGFARVDAVIRKWELAVVAR